MAGKPVICISGFAAVGKSTVGKMLAKRMRLRYVSGGDALKEVAKQMGFSPKGPGWWETEKGLEFLKMRAKDPKFDRKVDRKLLEICRSGGVVVDSWVMPWLYKGRSFKVWLTADKKMRAQRMAMRTRMTTKKAMRLLNKRDSESSKIYRKLYGIRMGEDFEPFHLIVDTSRLEPRQVVEIIENVAKHYFRKPTRRKPS
ncbi:MAG: cytidylate kinase family protein [Candidatus Caldarchaeum sp.]|nr:cytidylate kinase family protein [Candidatus Caldarchaeum sp.]